MDKIKLMKMELQKVSARLTQQKKLDAGKRYTVEELEGLIGSDYLLLRIRGGMKGKQASRNFQDMYGMISLIYSGNQKKLAKVIQTIGKALERDSSIAIFGSRDDTAAKMMVDNIRAILEADK